MADKTYTCIGGLTLDAEIRLSIAAQACLLILGLDLGYYRGWSEIVVYPDTFVAQHEEVDESGVVHQGHRALEGEAWDEGPVILSWADARPGAQPHGGGTNVVLHELAHKLDMLNGAANGMPPLHDDMPRQDWTQAFSAAYRDLRERIDYGRPTRIDPYAAEDPAEFFAVVTETFFEAPRFVHTAYPAVYAQLRRFYRQDPLWRMTAEAGDRRPPGSR